MFSNSIYPLLKRFFKYRILRKDIFSNSEQSEIFFSQFLSNNDLVFDIGANWGQKTKIFSNLARRVVAVEPQNEFALFIYFTHSKSVVIESKALGSHKHKSKIHIADSGTLSSLSTKWIESVSKGRFNKSKWSKTRTIKVDTLDNLILKYGLPKFCKIDVEGYELEVLRGLTKTIPYISFEYTLPEFYDNTIECCKYIHTTFIGASFNLTIGEEPKFIFNNWKTFDYLID